MFRKVCENVSAKQRAMVLVAILLILLVATGLLFYSITQVQSYDGIFVSGVRQVWY